MRAVAIQQFGGRETLQVMELPVPSVGSHDVLIQVRAAGVNPVDWKIREGWLREMFPHVFPVIPGWDVAGIVTEVGPQATRVAVGDHVYAYCRAPTIQWGAYAEYLVLPHEQVCRKPRTLSFEEAASIPLAALTAYQSLFDAARLREGETVLIHAAAGGVGGFAVQLAKHAGATVIGTARPSNHDYLRELGVDRVIDYTSRDFREAVRAWYPDGLDVVYDCAGGPVLEHSAEVLKTTGRLVTITDRAQAAALKARGLHAAFVFVEPNAAQLETLTALIEQGALNTLLAGVLPLDEAAKAHERLEAGHGKGKLVLTV